MENIEEIIERLQRNEEISKKFFEVEVCILSILNFKDLFENLLTEIRKKFEIPYVWLTLIRNNQVAQLVREFETSALLKRRLNVIDKETFLGLVGSTTRPLLVSNDLSSYFKLFPDHEQYLIRSLAVTPINLHGEVIGSLNCGDHSPDRYQPGMDVSLLERLSVKLSICISNVAAHERIRLAATRDPLTGLINRRVMESILKREYGRSLRYDSSLAVAFLDLDDFKSINDQYGHDTGDGVLMYVAAQMTRMSRESDVVTRYAGDEFVIILPGTKPNEAHQMMIRLNRYLSSCPLTKDGTTIGLSISFGISHIHDSGVQDPASLLKRADERLYEAKKEKKKKSRVISFERQ